MKPSHHVLAAALLGGMALTALPSLAQDANYPSRPVTLVVGYPAGGSTDLTGRTLGEALAKQLGVPVVTAFQVCRLIAVLLLVAPLYRWLHPVKV